MQPDSKRDMAILEDGADFNGEWLFAGVALVSADTGAFPAQLVHAMSFAAFRADGTVRPNAGFNPSIGSFLVMKMIAGKNGHDTLLFERNLGHPFRYGKYNMPTVDGAIVGSAYGSLRAGMVAAVLAARQRDAAAFYDKRRAAQ